MSLPLNINPLLVADNQCPVIDDRTHPTEVRTSPVAHLWCLECEIGWTYTAATSTLLAWMVDLLPVMTELKIQVRKLKWRSVATLTATGTALTDGDTVTIGTRVYTFKTLLTGAVNEVLIGAATASLANLKKAVNGQGNGGVFYGPGTVPHELVEAMTLTGTTVLLFEVRDSVAPGTVIAKAETSTNLSWDAGTTFTNAAPVA